ncbi:MAG TPA: hypothetical protein DET40_14360 [Lentisphaeria bacterium]|nr:MAG: hypothetical protein A2X45_05535 [Lentisphaerae bacterium GWF2_50_93]HCE44721.1 hypothetical protein [Lentisphaeria bacterium]
MSNKNNFLLKGMSPLYFTAFILITITCLVNYGKITQKSFNSKEWILGNELTRGEMARDLVSSKVLIGKTKEEVVELLGQPSSSKSSFNNDRFYYIVDIGRGSYVFDMPCKLNLYFDGDNKVEDAYVAD